MTKEEIIKKYKEKIREAEHKVGTSKYCTAVATIQDKKAFLKEVEKFDGTYVPDIKLLYAYTKYLSTRYKNLDQGFWNDYNAIWRRK